MSRSELFDRVSSRARAWRVSVTSEALDGCCSYLELLARWNRRINLTALPLSPLTDATIDKLVIEPIFGVPLLPETTFNWVDLGSGGGSPAIPLCLAANRGVLTLVESRQRKCAFLREAVRAVGLEGTRVESRRFESFAGVSFDVATFRAVRIDQPFAHLLARILAPGGLVISFGTPVKDPRFSPESERILPDQSTLFASRLTGV